MGFRGVEEKENKKRRGAQSGVCLTLVWWVTSRINLGGGDNGGGFNHIKGDGGEKHQKRVRLPPCGGG